MGITSNNIRNEREALVYLTECTLATVSDLAYRARPPKGELNRQISIAQTGIDWLRALERDTPRSWSGSSRVAEILDDNLSVEAWADARKR